MRIDLHTHSTASDGTTSPTEVVARAAAVGLDVLALTDHDTQAGIAEAADEARRHALTLVPGAELSCTWQDVRLHLLAYLFEPSDQALLTRLEEVRDDRVPRLRKITALLDQAGFHVEWDEVQAKAGGASLGRPHLADALVDRGYVADRDEAFRELLHDGSPYYVPHITLDVIDAIGLVRAAGGVTVFAHPLARFRGDVVPDDAIVEMSEAGLAGLEVDHRDNAAVDRAHLRGLAADLGLVVTGSSDYHGAGKQENELGENTTDTQAWEALLAAATGDEPVVGLATA